MTSNRFATSEKQLKLTACEMKTFFLDVNDYFFLNLRKCGSCLGKLWTCEVMVAVVMVVVQLLMKRLRRLRDQIIGKKEA